MQTQALMDQGPSQRDTTAAPGASPMQPPGSGPVYSYSGSANVANVPGVTGSIAPAHFRTPSVPMDPPGTAITQNTRVSGRPAMSWAAALLACGLFVGVAAVAVLQSSDAVAETTASFVDPSRAPIRNAAGPAMAAQAGQGMAPTPVPVTPNGVPAPPPNPFTAPATPPSGVVAPPAPLAAVPSASAPGAGVGGFSPVFAPVAITPSAAPPPKPKPVWRPVAAPARSVSKPAAVASADDEAKKEKETKAAEVKEPPKTKKRDAPDDETKKAYEALQKAQLESANAFGN
jgi:hypothetical protein